MLGHHQQAAGLKLCDGLGIAVTRWRSQTDGLTFVECSICPTFAAVACFIDNARWDGVPFLLKAGKALHSKRAEIRVQFRHVPGNLYKNRLGVDLDQTTNELVSSCAPITFRSSMSCCGHNHASDRQIPSKPWAAKQTSRMRCFE